MVFLRGRPASIPLEGAGDLSGFMLGVGRGAGRRFASVAVVAVVNVFWGLRVGVVGGGGGIIRRNSRIFKGWWGFEAWTDMYNVPARACDEESGDLGLVSRFRSRPCAVAVNGCGGQVWFRLVCLSATLAKRAAER